MYTGMLWFDNNPKKDLIEKLREAAGYYQKKYGQRPDLCYVHPSMLADASLASPGIEIRPNPVIRPYHLWLGVEPHPAAG